MDNGIDCSPDVFVDASESCNAEPDMEPKGTEITLFKNISDTIDANIPPVTGTYTVSVIPVDNDSAYQDAVDRIRVQVTDKFDASKKALMSRLEMERSAEVQLNNLELARRYENELRILSECQLEELENVNVAIKCEISTVQTRFGIKALTDLVARTNEELMRDNMVRLRELSAEYEETHRLEIEQLHITYRDQLKMFEKQLDECARTAARTRLQLETRHKLEIDELHRKYTAMRNNEIEQAKSDIRIQYQLEKDEEYRTMTSLKSKTGDSGFWNTENGLNNSGIHVEQECQTDCDTLASNHVSEEIGSVLATHRKEMEMKEKEVMQLRGNFEQEVAQLRDSLETENKELRYRLDKWETMKTSEDYTQVDPLRASDHEHSVHDSNSVDMENKDYQDYADRLTEMEQNEAELQELKDTLAAREAELEQVRLSACAAELANQQRVGELEQRINDLQSGVVHATVDDSTSTTVELISSRDAEVIQLNLEAEESNKTIRLVEGELVRVRHTLEQERSRSEQLQEEVAELQAKLQHCMLDHEHEMTKYREECHTMFEQRVTEEIRKVKDEICNTSVEVIDNNNASQRLLSLQAELELVKEEKNSVGLSNQKILNTLSEMVRTVISIEERVALTSRNNENNSSDSPVSSTGDEPRNSSRASSMFTDEGLEGSRHFSENHFTGPELDSDTEDFISDSLARLERVVLELCHFNVELKDSVTHRMETIALVTSQYQELNKELQSLANEKTRLSFQLTEAQHESEILKEKCALMEDNKTTVGELQQRLKSLENERNELQSKVDQHLATNVELQELRDIEMSEADRLKNDNETALDIRREKLQQQLHTLRSELDISRHESSQFQERIENQELEVNNIKALLLAKNSEIERLNDQIKQYSELQSASCLPSVDEREVKCDVMLQVPVSSEENNEDLNTKLAHQDSLLRSLKAELSDKVTEIESLQTLLNEKMLQLVRSSDELTQLQVKLQTLTDRLKHEEELVMKLKQDNADLECRHLEELNALNESHDVAWTKELTKITARHAQELSDSDTACQRQIATIKEEHQRNFESLQLNVDERDSAASIQDSSCEQEKEFQELRKKLKRENEIVLERLQKEFDEHSRTTLATHMETETVRLMDEVRAMYDTEVTRAKREMEAENREIWAEVERRQKEEMERAVKEAEEKCANENAERIKLLASEQEDELRRLKAKHACEMESLRSRHEKEIRELIGKYENMEHQQSQQTTESVKDGKSTDTDNATESSLRERHLLTTEIESLRLCLSDREQRFEELQHNSADRDSLLDEVDDLRAQIETLQREMLSENNKLADRLAQSENNVAEIRRKSKHQVDTLTEELRQEYLVVEQLRLKLLQYTESQTESSTTNREREDFHNKIADLESALNAEKKAHARASLAFEEERMKNISLLEARTKERLANEKFVQQFELELLRNVQHRNQISAVYEVLRMDLMREKQEHNETKEKAESLLKIHQADRDELERIRKEAIATERKYNAKLTELKTTLKVQSTRNKEIKSSLEKEFNRSMELRAMLEEERFNHDDIAHEHDMTLVDLQARLDLEHAKVKGFHGLMRAEQGRSANLSAQIEECIDETATAAYRELYLTVQCLKEQKLDLSDELQFLRERTMYLESERDRLSFALDLANRKCRDLECRTTGAGSSESREITRSTTVVDGHSEASVDAHAVAAGDSRVGRTLNGNTMKLTPPTSFMHDRRRIHELDAAISAQSLSSLKT